jgi:Sulfotransferase family
VVQLDVAAINESAAAIAEVDNPDPAPFLSNLELLADAINAEAGLTPAGSASAHQALALALRNRMEVSAWTMAHPEILDEEIDRPIFLTGLPRSGTTYFQYLFDAEPSMRMLRHWEGERPCPPPGFDPGSARRRIDDSRARARARQANSLHAEITKIHLSDVEGPEECVAIMDQTFGNVGNYWTYRIPGYFARCLETVNLRACYEHHKSVLQLLQWKAEPRRWVLKWPCHLVALNEIMAVYPDASFVMTHRDPVQALASNCSLAALLRTATAEKADRFEIGQQMKDMIRAYLERLVQFDAGTARVAHVGYETAVERPEVAMTSVFSTLGIELTPTVRESIVAWRHDNPPGKRGTHAYSLADYGLDARQVAQEYAFYTDRFAIPAESRAQR